ncbi:MULTISPECIES: hypothetical protein [Microbacterium]|uniref:hypothetical protein n=1 Tax=Microbacterium TaxID=33882 RepID=UPI00048CBC1E|nr:MULTISPECIES: hypothetical protein [Microbacterium]
MSRRTGEETKSLLLRVGMQMLLERGVSAGVQHIRLQDVLRRAGLTTGAAYRLWGDQTDYQRDLAVAMVRMRVAGPTDFVRAAVEDLVREGAPGDDIIRAAALSHVRSTTFDTHDEAEAREAQSFLIALALRTTADTWPQLKEAGRERHRESMAAFADFVGSLMEAYGMRMKTGLSVRDFAEAMGAMGEGFAVRAIEGIDHPTFDFTPEDEAPTGRWTLFALGMRALVNEFMVAADAAPGDA